MQGYLGAAFEMLEVLRPAAAQVAYSSRQDMLASSVPVSVAVKAPGRPFFQVDPEPKRGWQGVDLQIPGQVSQLLENARQLCFCHDQRSRFCRPLAGRVYVWCTAGSYKQLALEPGFVNSFACIRCDLQLIDYGTRSITC